MIEREQFFAGLSDAIDRQDGLFGEAASDLLGVAYHLIPPNSLRRIARVFAEGEKKYPGRAVNYRNIRPALHNTPWKEERYSHTVDHLFMYHEGDTTEDHLAKVAWYCIMMMEIRRKEEE